MSPGSPEPDRPSAAIPPASPKRFPAVPLPLLVALALCGFAANSLLCRVALLRPARIDALSFSLLRLAAGAVTLLLFSGLARARGHASRGGVIALILYMFAFSFSYLRIGAALGALLLFGAVQVTMLAAARLRGERLQPRTWLGLAVASIGVIWLMAPGVGAPDPLGSALMLVAGVFWGTYSLLGRRSTDALGTTAGNFAYAAAIALPLGAALYGLCVLLPPLGPYLGLAGGRPSVTRAGLLLALGSGGLASGLGYAIWYSVLPRLGASRAAIVQLLVPVLAASLAVPLLAEALSLRLLGAGALVLCGVGLALRR